MRTRTRQTRAPIVKDLRLHGRAFALTLAAGLLLCLTLNRVEPQAVGARVSLVCNINLLLTLLWSDWLITRERSKRTFAWLRGLPVDDGVLASAKFLVAGGCCVTFPGSLPQSLLRDSPPRGLGPPVGGGCHHIQGYRTADGGLRRLPGLDDEGDVQSQ